MPSMVRKPALKRRALTRRAPLLGLLATLGACAAQPAPTTGARPADNAVAIDANAYGRAFDAARDALRSAGFTLDRIDARAGVITTLPVSSAGLATPWSRLDPDFAARFRRTLRYERLRARVEFTPTDSTITDQWNLARFAPGAVARIRVEVEPVPRPGLRVSPLSPRLSSVARLGPTDPRSDAPVSPADQPLAGALAERDDALASILAQRVAAALREAGG